MKKIEELFKSLSDHQPVIDGLSEIKVEAGWKLQQPNGVNGAGGVQRSSLPIMQFLES
jgi:hypothetical protein